MIEVKFTKKDRHKALRYLCTNGLLYPSDPYCVMVVGLVMSEDITLLCYKSAGKKVRVLFKG